MELMIDINQERQRQECNSGEGWMCQVRTPSDILFTFHILLSAGEAQCQLYKSCNVSSVRPKWHPWRKAMLCGSQHATKNALTL